MALSVSKYLNYGVREMSGGVKGVRYQVKKLNKYIPTDSRNYGIPYPVINSPLKSFSNKPFDKNIHQEYLQHENINNLKGLEVELIYKWEVGSMLIFDRTHLHCSSSIIEGKKIGIATFTKK